MAVVPYPTHNVLVGMESKSESESSSSDASTGFSALPENSIVDILKLMTPLDACRLSATSRSFRSAAESDALWRSFLPPDYMEILSRSSDSSSRRGFSSMKELFFSLCDSPLLIDEGRKSFWLDKKRGKKCYMLAARDLTIKWDDSPESWIWTSVPESRFPEVAIPDCICWFEVWGQIESRMLSPGTWYAAYLVFGVSDPFGFEDCEVTASFGVAGEETTVNIIYLDANTEVEDEWPGNRFVSIEDVRSWIKDTLPELYSSQAPGNQLLGLEDVRTWLSNNVSQLYSSGQPLQEAGVSRQSDGVYPVMRKDGFWSEIKLGEYFNEGEENLELEIAIKQLDDHWKGGITIEEIAIISIHEGSCAFSAGVNEHYALILCFTLNVTKIHKRSEVYTQLLPSVPKGATPTNPIKKLIHKSLEFPIWNIIHCLLFPFLNLKVSLPSCS